MFRTYLLLLFLLAGTHISYSQNKAVVIQNLWSNELNPYNPQEYLDKLYTIFKEKLSVKEFSQEPGSFKTLRNDAEWKKKIVEQLKAKNSPSDSIYYIAFASELKLPTLNLGKILFKNPPRSSKYIFSFHIYNGAGDELMGDTIINRGCVVKSIDGKKGSGYFYSDYRSFMDDMVCHIQVIRKILQEKTFIRKQKQLARNERQ
ncbi:MAG: hypothetical protein JWQ40_3535 [Segetibacter sp.]|jgi:hypothetical protein|nr:hypothetical protein [Segetibacter sp.]